MTVDIFECHDIEFKEVINKEEGMVKFCRKSKNNRDGDLSSR
jgi:hypothetical protein